MLNAEAVTVGEAERAHYKRQMISFGMPVDTNGTPIMGETFLDGFAQAIIEASKLDVKGLTPNVKIATTGIPFDSDRDGVVLRLIWIHEQHFGRSAITQSVADEYDRLVARYGLPTGPIGGPDPD